MKLVALFDDSIKKLEAVLDPNGTLNGFNFKRVNKKEIFVNPVSLKNILSSGTIRGINLYGSAIFAFIFESYVLVDELEKNFNKNLIGNLFLMFNDPSINTKNACLIYSTHYSELLDETKRCDNINILHREDDVITIRNMHKDYSYRTDMLKSSSFNQNVFDTLINYDKLMELKRAMRRK